MRSTVGISLLPAQAVAEGQGGGGCQLLARGQWIGVQLVDALKRMVAFRTVAAHDYQSLLLPILVNVITLHLGEFLVFTRIVLLRDGAAKA